MAYKQLKYWFDVDLAKLLAAKISQLEPSFDSKAFVKVLKTNVEELELKDRVELMADELYNHLGRDYSYGIGLLVRILGPENEDETGMFKNFYWVMPIAKYVEKYGINDFELSMNAIEEITKRNTGEYAIRPFLETHPKRTLLKMKSWSKNANKHVRRLSSEGMRPRLPWAKKMDIFIKNPKPLLPILNNLKDDTSKYVQKSVANCINDILKDNLAIGMQLIETWNIKNIGKERKWIIKHALRNLLKNEDKWAIKMIR